MRDDRFNSLKQEFSGVPDDAADALSSMPELIRAAFFLLSTKEYKSTGLGNDSNLLIVFYVQIMPDDLVMQLHRF